MTQKLKVTNLYKIFGSKPNKALADLKIGNSKDKIFSETGHVVGVMNASFTVHEGEIFVIMGLSGSGKSTLVRMLNRLIEPTSGEVVLDGIDILKQNKKDLRNLRREKISMVFQSFALMPHMTVIDNVAFGLDLAGLGREERMERSSDALEQVGLSAYENSMPRELSGGQQQRVGLARALANDPDILLMDEAFSALDPIIRTEMQDELLRLQSEHKRTIIFISHDLDEALRIGDRIAIMRDGLIVQIDTPRELANNPADDYVRNFFEKANTGHLFRAIDMIESGEKTGAQNIDENMSLPDVVKAAAAQGLPLNVINDSGAVLGHITQQNLLTNLSEQA